MPTPVTDPVLPARPRIFSGMQPTSDSLHLGNLLGGGACVLVYDRYGWVPAIGLLAALTAVGLLVVWRLREPARIARVPGAGQAYRALLSVFGQPGCRWWTFGVVPLVYTGAGAAYALVTPALVATGTAALVYLFWVPSAPSWLRRSADDRARWVRPGVTVLALDDGSAAAAEQPLDDLIALSEALERLERLDARQAQVVECRFFGGLSLDETAAAHDAVESGVTGKVLIRVSDND